MLIPDEMRFDVQPGTTELGVIGLDEPFAGYLVKQVVIDTTLANGPVYVDGFAGGLLTIADEIQVIVIGIHTVIFRHLSTNTDVVNRMNCPGGVDSVQAPDGAMRWWIRINADAATYGITNGVD